MVGRPTKLTDDVIQQAWDYIDDGWEKEKVLVSTVVHRVHDFKVRCFRGLDCKCLGSFARNECQAPDGKKMDAPHVSLQGQTLPSL